MRDPERLASGNGISDFERELLDAGKKETMPAALREQMERALGFGAVAMPAAPVRARVEAATGVKASAIVWISAGVLVLGVVGGILGARLGSRLFPPHAVAPSSAPPSPPAVTAETSPPSGVASPAPAVATNAPLATGEVGPVHGGRGTGSVASPARRTVALAGSPVRSRAHAAAAVRSRSASGARDRHSRASTSPAKVAASAASASAAASVPAASAAPATGDTQADRSAPEPQAYAVAAREPRPSSEEVAPRAVVAAGDLRAEIDLIDGARAALRAGETSRALDLLGTHSMHYPHGALAPEETALRVEALMRLGRTGEARAYARRFVAANPASPLAERMRRLVNGDVSQ